MKKSEGKKKEKIEHRGGRKIESRFVGKHRIKKKK